MNKKGQGSIEFMMLVAISMIYISLIIVPSIEISRSAAEDVMQLSQAVLAGEKLANTVDSVASSSGEARQTVIIFVPERGNLECDGANKKVKIKFLLTKSGSSALLKQPSICPDDAGGNGICLKEINTISIFSCNPSSIGDYSLEDPVSNTKTAKVEKNAAGEISVVFS